MFWGCSKLNKVIMLATDISASNCLGNWLKYAASIGTIVKNPDLDSLPSGSNGKPSNWTIEDYISELDA